MPKPKHFLGEDHYLPNSDATCPVCSHPLDGASGIDSNARPKPEDIGVCIECATPLVYKDDMRLRIMTPSEFKSLPHKVRAAIAFGMAAIKLTELYMAFNESKKRSD